MKNLCIMNTVILCTLTLSLAIWFVVKYRKTLIRFLKKNQVVRFLSTVLIPYVISLIISVPSIFDSSKKAEMEISNNVSCANGMECDDIKIGIIILLSIATANLVVQALIWFKEKKEADIRWENQAAKYAFNNLYEIYSSKNSQLRTAYHRKVQRGSIEVPYNVFDQIRKITWEFCNTISRVTNIPTKDWDAAFVYRYTYAGSNEKDRAWRWVTGKGSKFKPKLNDFAETADSTFHYLSNNNVSTLFYNDKSVAVKEQRYLNSYRDYNHACKGSIFAAKVAFSGNDQNLVEGIIMITSYGHKFMDNLPGQTEVELKELIQDSIFPCFRKLLTTELAMLYFRHENERPEESKKCIFSRLKESFSKISSNQKNGNQA